MGLSAGSFIVLFELTADGEDGHSPLLLDFEQGDITRISELDQQFTVEGIIRVGLATTEGKGLKHVESREDRLLRTVRGSLVPEREEANKPFNVPLHPSGQAKTISHLHLT